MQAQMLAGVPKTHLITIVNKSYSAGKAEATKIAENSTNSEEEKDKLLDKAMAIMKQMAENAASSAREIQQESNRKRPKKQRSPSGSNEEVEASSSSNKRPPPPPPAAAIKAIKEAATDGAIKGATDTAASSTDKNAAAQAYSGAQDEALKAALEAADRANASKEQAEAIIDGMKQLIQQIAIEAVVAIKNAKRPASPIPVANPGTPEIKQIPKKLRAKSKSREATPVPATPPRPQSVTPQARTRSRSAKRANSAEPYKPFTGTPHRLFPDLPPVKEKPTRAKSARPVPTRAPSKAKPSQAPELTVVPVGPSSSREVSIKPPRAKSVKPSRARSKSQEESAAAVGPTPSGSKKSKRALSQPPVIFNPDKNDPYTQFVDS